MTMQAINAVQRTITVDVPIEQAFDVFTTRFDSWWPRTHHIGEADIKRAVIEPREGGRWFEIGVDGSETDWGRVVLWDPPNHVVLTWQIDGTWHYDPALVTTVEVRFSVEGPGRTRVDVEHRDLDRFGDAQAEMRTAFESEGGWSALLAAFAAAA